jgi:hypothetical protein
VSPFLIILPLIEIAVALGFTLRLRRLWRLRQESYSKLAHLNALSQHASKQLMMTGGASTTGSVKMGDPVPTVSSHVSFNSEGLVYDTIQFHSDGDGGGITFQKGGDGGGVTFYSDGSGDPAYTKALEAYAQDKQAAKRAAWLMRTNEDYQETVDLLLRAYGYKRSEIVLMSIDVRMNTVVTINDNMKSKEAARAWFQKALELTY